ncbi:TolB family protein [Robiginitalea sp. IMCC43444]|uniref:TolB family protein n=1 Tax=Robiginitalea sp. IMCC43444 TaxID=3459121 RepID=UPI0040413083
MSFKAIRNCTLTILPLLILLGCKNTTDSEVPLLSDHPITEPELFAPGIISTAEFDEFDISFHPNGRRVYFTRRARGEKQKIMISEFVDGTWARPELAPFSTDRDETPFVVPDGSRLYFGSQRPIPGRENLGNFDMNIWVVDKTEEGWGEPEPLPEIINAVQEEGENWPSSNANFFFSPDGLNFYFTSMYRGDQGIELYRTRLQNGEYSQPEKVTGLFEKPEIWKYNATLTPDGQYLLFNSYGLANGFGGEDIYVSRKTKSGWSEAVNLGPLVNTPGEEGAARFSPDGRYFFFCHADNLGDEQYGPWSIYYTETSALKLSELFN